MPVRSLVDRRRPVECACPTWNPKCNYAGHPKMESPRTVSSLLFGNDSCGCRFAFGVSAFRSQCHGLAVFRNDGFTLTMVLPTSLFDFTCERVRIYLFDGDGVPRRSGNWILFTVIFGGVATIDRSAVL